MEPKSAKTPPAAAEDSDNSESKRASPVDISHFDKLPDAAMISVKALATVVGKGVSTVWRNCQEDPEFPKPIRLSRGCTRFKVGDIRAYLAAKVCASAQSSRVQGKTARGRV